MASSAVDVDAKVVAIRNVPSSLLGWLVVGAMAVFLIWKMVGTFDTKLNTLIDSAKEQVKVLERIEKAIDRK